MSTPYTSTIQRRKTTKSKQSKSLEKINNATAVGNEASANPVPGSVSPTLGGATSVRCNGITTRMLNCCRDVNCRLNNIAKDCNREVCKRMETNSQQHCASSIRSSHDDNGYIVNNGEQCSGRINSRTSSLRKRISRSLGVSTSSYGSCRSTVDPNDEYMDTYMQQRYYLNSKNFEEKLYVNIQIDLIGWLLFFVAFMTRFYKLSSPPNVVFDELHYGKYISLYMRNIFFFDQHPPLGKQLIAGVAHLVGYDGNYTFPRIGAEYTTNVPIFWLRFLPALCGSFLSPAVYMLLQEARLNRWTALLGGVLVIFENALLTQSRFVLMESMLLLFSTIGLYFLLKFQRYRFGSKLWLIFSVLASVFLTCTFSVKYPGILSYCLAGYLMWRYFWDQLFDATISSFQIVLESISRILIFTIIPIAIYLGVFWIHLSTLHRAGPHDSIMTSAFQASLEGGLASITRGQPLEVAHGSQITLRHTHGRLCWLHSHTHVYPVRYPDKRGSSHQQQVTCYSFKDVNNWWIVKRPDREELMVDDEPDAIRDGDIIQLVHGITSRALNSHDVAAPVTPQCQEVSCYIDYEIKMKGELLWRVEILNKDTEGPIWHAIKSEIRLIHVTTGAALRFTGRQLPDWGFNQHEVAADRTIDHKDAIWNVEEHRYTKTQDKREREIHLLNAEMIPTKKTKLTFLDKFIELQLKMLFHNKKLEGHMYSSEPYEWPLMDKTIAYWIDGKSKSQIHLIGNVAIWYTGTLALITYFALATFYTLRRRRECYDLPTPEWERFIEAGDIFFIGYLIHYLPYYFVDQTLFLHHYLPAFLFKLMLLCFVIDHVDYLICNHFGKHQPLLILIFRSIIGLWMLYVAFVFVIFLPLSYGANEMTADEVNILRWKDTWDFIL